MPLLLGAGSTNTVHINNFSNPIMVAKSGDLIICAVASTYIYYSWPLIISTYNRQGVFICAVIVYQLYSIRNLVNIVQ